MVRTALQSPLKLNVPLPWGLAITLLSLNTNELKVSQKLTHEWS